MHDNGIVLELKISTFLLVEFTDIMFDLKIYD